ncbi:extracellular solute-binding protein [Microbacterium esteraromaticum]|uniref:Extracellular solute-binding protein n=1 Tax=Microbacterium esteraromaticum TaxID=57043 RepID=A0A939DW31_9MICO|nr:extracellular solute-binding protein [Microbacterium esteraromaticum]MBN8205098.1 extracellular solute-binding protein [Microbacterium esteraromaticum]MBN8415252.1 extracellular solute-binding protein [Microbacterium esteraromaticum]
MKTRKFMTLGALATIGALALTGCSGAADTPSADGDADKPYAGETIVVTTFGGDWEKAFVTAVVDPFEAETGANVELVTLYSADALAQVTAQKASPQIDVVHFSGGQEYTAAQEGLIDPIAADDLSEYDNLVSVATAGLERGEGPVIQLAPIGLVYNTESGAPAPTSWEDLFDEAYAGHVALPDLSNSYGVLSMLRVADVLGGGIDDTEQAIADLGALAASGDAIVVPTSPDLQTAFAQRGTWLAPYAMDYAGTLQDAGLPVEFIVPEEGVTASLITANVVSGRENTELAKLFVDFELRPEAQKVFAEEMRYSPVNSATELSAEAAESVLTGDALDAAVVYAPGDIAGERQAWIDSWNALITQ